MNLADGLKQLSRMCARCKCADCPMCDIGFCSLDQSDRSTDANEKAARIIEKWAAEHPEPVYPTWLEFVKTYETGEPKSDLGFVFWMGTTSIPADIAQKLGIKPKEG